MSTQAPDTKPGDYYVTAIDSTRTAFLLGPFTDDHEGALARVDEARRYVQDKYARAAWWAFGTSRIDTSESNPVGKLNVVLA